MGMDNTPAPGRVHIGFSGRGNTDKFSVLSAVTDQNLAIVSNVKGITMDPVHKAMELLPLGPMTMINTPGTDDEEELGSLRVRKSHQMLNKTDMAVLVVDHCHGMTPEDSSLLKRMEEKRIPCVIVCDKTDLEQKDPGQVDWKQSLPLIKISALTGQGAANLKECLVALRKIRENSRRIVRDLLEPRDFAVLVVPIDKAAPKGRLILPQQQTIRDILEADATAVVLRESELAGMLPALEKGPKMMIMDNQVFAKVSTGTPEDILLISFSTLFARYKEDLEQLVEGMTTLDHMGKGDRILVSKGCTHHGQYGDIGTAKLPSWVQGFMGTEPELVFTSGTEFPDGLSGYRLITHCGGYMLDEREMKYGMKCTRGQCVPVINYGITITYIHGTLRCSLELFPHIAALLDREEI